MSDSPDTVQRPAQPDVATGPLLAALDALSRDMHNRSDRPCATCQAITDAIGKPFGCIAYAIWKLERTHPSPANTVHQPTPAE